MKFAIDEERETLWIDLDGKLYPFRSCGFNPAYFLGDDMSSYGACPCRLKEEDFKEIVND
jgi:hypothetical protein